jgi:hypothetical protein
VKRQLIRAWNTREQGGHLAREPVDVNEPALWAIDLQRTEEISPVVQCETVDLQQIRWVGGKDLQRALSATPQGGFGVTPWCPDE